MIPADPIDFLFSLERLGMKFGLGQITRLCDALGHPERAFASVIVGGTNGKGSVTAMTDTGLRAAGHRTGRYTSPHLVRIEERFAVDGREVATGDLRRAASRVRDVVIAITPSGEPPPTFFECTTAVAFELFRTAGVEIAVLEVGLGGRLDSTNVVSPIAAAIVSIDFDHQAQLGTTLASIAFEKAGIIKPGIPVVCGPLPGEARAVVASACAERHAPLIRADRDVHLDARVVHGAMRADIRTPRHSFTDVPLSLAGRHQAANAAVVVRLLETLDGLGMSVSADAMVAALTTTVWPGRLERIAADGCTVILDAAHNPAGARALAEYVRETAPGGAIVVFGAMKDKDVGAMIAALAPITRHLVCTTAPTPRALDAEAIGALAAAAGVRCSIEPDPVEALAGACRLGSPVVVAGSIFLVGPLRDRLARGILR